jgi:uncharacterized protein (TIGR03437 family)
MRLAYPLLPALALTLSAQSLSTTQIASGISGPTDIQNAADGSGRLFFVQQNGIIRIFRNGVVSSRPFLDISTKTKADGERGLLGLTFPPAYAQKQRFYVDYTDLNGDTVIAQYRLTADPDVADSTSEIVLLHIAQPFPNHNGGQVRFGPDGYLYIAMGDGGSGGDPLNNGQSLGTLLGKLLRIDVESTPGTVVVPPSNPLVHQTGARPEIWAYGLRNPWRFTFDRVTHDLWIGDVGQDAYEEVDFQPAGDSGGENYGWNIMEASHCYQPGCGTQGLTLPVAEYSHAEGCSIIGGFVYRGRVSPGLRGLYLYGDLCSGTIWGLEKQGPAWMVRKMLSTTFSITTFGEDEAGELYVSNAGNGTIHHLVGDLAPRLNPAGIGNAASFAPGLVAGSLATAFAAGVLDDPGIVTNADGVTVSVNGIAAPVLSRANVNGLEQVNFQVPFEIAGQTGASVIVARDGHSSAPAIVAVLPFQPAIYAAVHNADFSAITTSHPLTRGEYAAIFATGLGPASNQPPTGGPAPANPLARVQSDVKVSIGGVACDIPFAGLGPGLIGVYQVNCLVPATAPSGVQNLTVTVNGVAGPPIQVPVM